MRKGKAEQSGGGRIAKDKKQGTTIPKHELEALAETLYPAIVEFFESDEGKREFKTWQEQQKIAAEKQS